MKGYVAEERTAGLHYHHSDETFTVIGGSYEILPRDGSRTQTEKGSLALIPAKNIYDIKNTGLQSSCRAGQPGASIRRLDDIFGSRAQCENEGEKTAPANLIGCSGDESTACRAATLF